MGPPLELTSPTAPLCTNCGVRYARPAPGGGFRRLCLRCWRMFKGGQRRAKARAKTAVLAALGNCCACPGEACWHSGPCPVTDPEVLTVDHTDGTGHLARRQRRDGTLRTRQTTADNWATYLAELRAGSRALRCLCHNCHHRDTTRQRRAALEATLAPHRVSRL